MIKKLNYLWLAALLIAGACKKDKDEPTPAAASQVAYFTQLKTGNYWVYERYNVEPSGTATPLGIYDSCYVEGDTVIGNYTYAKYVFPGYPITQGMVTAFLRDSSEHLVDELNKVYFASADFNTVFSESYITAGNDTVAKEQTQMADKDLQVTVPAGIFGTRNFRTRYEMYPGFDNFGTIRDVNVRYGGGIGKVEERLLFYAGSPNYTERRLIRYHVQ